MKKFYTIVLIILVLFVSKQVFPQKENSKGSISDEQQIDLSEGFSFISSRLIPEDPNMLVVMASVLNENLDFIRNSQGQTIKKIGPNWVNGIGDWVVTEGYLVKMFDSNSFIIEGDLIDPATPISLTTGFQFVSYFLETPMDAFEAFETIIGDNLAFIRNSQAQTIRKIGPNWVNGIGDCKPGEGYLVKMINNDELIYPSSFTCGDPFTDLRDGQTYNTVLIGEQCWMAENINIGEMLLGSSGQTNNGVIEKYCYDNDTTNCDEYGGIYNWNEAMQYTTTSGEQGVCPDGWHIPTDHEWKILEGTVDSQYPVGDPIWNQTGYRGFDAGLNLKTTYGWYNNGNGTDSFGFSALPAGFYGHPGDFYNLGEHASFWSSTEYVFWTAYAHYLNHNRNETGRSDGPDEYGFSIRCLKGEAFNQAPEPPFSPDPEDGAEHRPIEINLSWMCIDPEGDSLTYDIYLGTESTPPLLAMGLTETTFTPEILESETKYFWKVVAHDDHNNSTEGPVWSFTTVIPHPPCPGTPTITYEGQVYNTILIGDQCWLKENLNVGTMIEGIEDMTNNSIIEKYCYDNDPANCEEYGGLYQWDEMMQYVNTEGAQGICPEGWHLPSDHEWKILEGTVDSQYPVGDPIWNNSSWRGFDAGSNLKSIYGWFDNGNGINLYGFNLLPGGYRDYNGNFYSIVSFSYFWSSTEYNNDQAWPRILKYNRENIGRSYNYIKGGYSVRCLKGEYLNLPPNPPSSPNPEDGAVNQSIGVNLSWTCDDPEGDPLTYDIYLGVDISPPLLATGVAATTYYSGTLETNTEYFWKILAHDDHNNSTLGPVWSFTTHESGLWICNDPFIDPRDGQSYKTTLIDNQCWMAENLNIGTMINSSADMTDNGTIEKYCYNNTTTNCDEYGGLYQWDEMMDYNSSQNIKGICPNGWHVATDEEWKILEGTVDSQYPVGDPIWNNTGWRGYDAGKNLKSISGWIGNGNGPNNYGFAILPGTFRKEYGYFGDIGKEAFLWTSTGNYSYGGQHRKLRYFYDDIRKDPMGKQYGLSVRCLNDTVPINLPPEPPYSPNPEHGAVNLPLEINLSWSCNDPENNPLSYDIYFGTTASPPQVSTYQVESSYYPGTLEVNTEYFWKIVAHDDHNNSIEGPVWSFITEEEPWQCGNPFTDPYNSQIYNTVQIGEQCWMAENINIGEMINANNNQTNNGIIEKHCYDNNIENCDEYGGLYQWSEMMQYSNIQGVQGICPFGWYLPTDNEWKILEGSVDSQYPVGDPIWDNEEWRGFDVGYNLKSTSGWYSNGNGSDLFGFSALPAGFQHLGSFHNIENQTTFWTSTYTYSNNSLYRMLYFNNEDAYRGTYYLTGSFSVRCLKD
jgi:uncharacterized protein (TIGR02145 family)